MAIPARAVIAVGYCLAAGGPVSQARLVVCQPLQPAADHAVHVGVRGRGRRAASRPSPRRQRENQISHKNCSDHYSIVTWREDFSRRLGRESSSPWPRTLWTESQRARMVFFAADALSGSRRRRIGGRQGLVGERQRNRLCCMVKSMVFFAASPVTSKRPVVVVERLLERRSTGPFVDAQHRRACNAIWPFGFCW